jgi:hypothetical protein
VSLAEFASPILHARHIRVSNFNPGSGNSSEMHAHGAADGRNVRLIHPAWELLLKTHVDRWRVRSLCISFVNACDECDQQCTRSGDEFECVAHNCVDVRLQQTVNEQARLLPHDVASRNTCLQTCSVWYTPISARAMNRYSMTCLVSLVASRI